MTPPTMISLHYQEVLHTTAWIVYTSQTISSTMETVLERLQIQSKPLSKQDPTRAKAKHFNYPVLSLQSVYLVKELG